MKIKSLYRRPFVRHVVTLATGTSIAQGITIAVSPIITRLYAPEEFGVMGAFISIIAILAPIVSLSFHLSIVLPIEDKNAIGLTKISFRMATIVVSVVTLSLLLIRNQIAELLHLESIGVFIYLLPVTLVFISIYEVGEQWLIRKKKFKYIARTFMTQSLITNSSKCFCGLIVPYSITLVLIHSIGYAIYGFLFYLGVVKSHKEDNENFINKYKSSKPNLKKLFIQYKDFTIYRTPQTLLISISQNFSVILLSSLFSPAAAGFYAISKRTLAVPNYFISKSIVDVFRPRIVQAVHKKENINRLILRTTLALALIALFFYLPIVLFGPKIFSIVFGSEWIKAGFYAQWMSLYLFFIFISRPCIATISILALEKFYLLFSAISSGARIGAFFVGFYIFSSDMYAIAIFSIVTSIDSIFFILYVLNKAKKANMDTALQRLY